MHAKKRSVISVFVLIAALLLVLPLNCGHPASAAGDKSVTLICRQDETILSGMEWALYRIGTRSGSEVQFREELSEYKMDLGDLSAETVDKAAKTIESYVTAAGLAPVGSGKTDTNGEIVFGSLDNGLYLASGKILRVDDTVYYPSALLLEVNNADTGLSYDAYPKFYYTDISGQSKAYTVKKVWVDDDNAAQQRPVSVTVDLFQNGTLYDTVTLNEENSWEHRWEALDSEANWLVSEREVPAHYEVMIDRNQTQFLIRNTFVPDVTTTAPPPETTTATTVTTPPSKLVQTGQLWWPVLPLSLGGVVLIGAGIKMRKKKDEA